MATRNFLIKVRKKGLLHMSNEKKIIYRREPIKKYKMHKVKKHWVVKGGVAGAMIVGSVGAPLVPHMVLAAETENVDPGDGEEVKAKSLEDVQETTPTVESTTEAVPETTAETEEATKDTTEDTTKDTEKTEDETKTSETKEKQARVVENEDGTKTWTAGEDLEISLNNVHLTDTDGKSPVQTEYSGENFGFGLHFELVFNEKVNIGDKILLPITGNKSTYLGYENTTTLEGLPFGAISGLGTLNMKSDSEGLIISVEQEIEKDKKIDVSLTGVERAFPKTYDENSRILKTVPIEVYLSGEVLETLTSTYNAPSQPLDPFRVSMSTGAGSSNANFGYSYYNDYKLGCIIKGEEIPAEPENIIQVARTTIESDSAVLNYEGKNKETLAQFNYMNFHVPTPDGTGQVLANVFNVHGLELRYVDVPKDATDEQINNILSSWKGNVYTAVENTDGTYTFASKVGTGNNGLYLKDTTEYKESGATSPVDFIGKKVGVFYDDPELINRINDAFNTQTLNFTTGFGFYMADMTVSHKIKVDYSDSLGNSRYSESTSQPSAVGIEGQSLIKINYIDENGNAIKSVMTKAGWPNDQTTITGEELAVKGYTLDKSKLPAGANPDTGEMNVTFPEEGKTTDITYVYTANNSTVDVKYMLDTDGDGVGDESINAGADDTSLAGKFGQLYVTQAKDYRDKNYVLSQRPTNAVARYDEPTPDVIYVYQEVGSLVIDDSILGENSRPSNTRYEINDDFTSLKDLIVPTPPTGYHYVDESGKTLTPGAAIQPAKKNADTTWTLAANDAKIIYHYVDGEGNEVAADIEVAAKVKDTIEEKINVVTGWLYVEKHADSDNDMIVDESGTSEITYVYKTMFIQMIQMIRLRC